MYNLSGYSKQRTIKTMKTGELAHSKQQSMTLLSHKAVNLLLSQEK